jgi:class I fructose-bisphosphate aldolase
MKKPDLDKIMTNGRAMFLAYDQGLEHGPTKDFNDDNVDPNYIIEIAKKGKYNAIIFQKGIAEKYGKEIKDSKVPLIIKLNGKTNLREGEPRSEQICSVKEAVSLGAVAVGYTIYIGSDYEEDMMKEFAGIEEEAHMLGMPVITWVYPRGKGTQDKSDSELMAYAARVALEVGADIAKIKYDGSKKDLKWAVKSAGKTKVVIAGGTKANEGKFLKEIKDIISAGGAGIAVGRNVWQSEDPFELSKKIRKIILGK